MGADVISQLVVTLGLDPAKFGSGVTEAGKNLKNFDALVKHLGVNEAKLDDKQKTALKTMREMAAQTSRTGKELHAATGINADFWKIAEKGALGFGSAIAGIALADFTRDTMSSVAAQGRLAATLGMPTQSLGALGDAIEASVGGSAESARSALAAMNKELQATRISGQSPENLMAISAILSRYNGGQFTPILDAAGHAQPLLSILESWAESVKKLGPQQAQGALGGRLPPDLINFLLLGREGMEAAINKASANQPDDATAKKFQQVETAATEAEQSLRKMAIAAVAAFSPELILGLKNLTAYLEWAARGFTDAGKRDNEIRQNDAEAWGADWLAKKDAERAWGMMHHPAPVEPPTAEQPLWRRALGAIGVHWGANNRDAIIPRLAQRIRAGDTLEQAAADEEANKPLPPLPPDSTLNMDMRLRAGTRAASNNNPTDLMYAGQAGASPDPYTDQWGVHHIMAKFADVSAGFAAAKHQVELDYGRGATTLRELAHVWAPNSDHNNEEAWAAALAERTGIDPGKVFDPSQFMNIVRAIPYAEHTVAAGDTTTNTVHMHGDVHVHTKATDARGIAKDMHGAIVAQSTTGAH